MIIRFGHDYDSECMKCLGPSELFVEIETVGVEVEGSEFPLTTTFWMVLKPCQ